MIANGDVFDVERIRKGLEQLRVLYCSQGYIDFTPVANTREDDETREITLHIDCDEGKQFRFGKLQVVGPELYPGDREKMLAAWQPYVGKIYDGAQVEQFLVDLERYFGAESTRKQRSEILQDPATATVNLRIVLPAQSRSNSALGWHSGVAVHSQP